MMKFKVEGYHIGIMAITILLIILGVMAVLIPSGSSPPSDTPVNQPTDQPIDQPSGESSSIYVTMLVLIAPLIIILLIMNFLIRIFHIMITDATGNKEEKGFLSNLKRSMIKDCYPSYDAGNQKCQKCDRKEGCQKETAKMVKKV